jgi:hypothetical protein
VPVRLENHDRWEPQPKSEPWTKVKSPAGRGPIWERVSDTQAQMRRHDSLEQKAGVRGAEL